jgi:2-hydroxycyclohexanecarboxyl-CoA dehydrogenase
MKTDLYGKVAIVTGSSKGIGKAIALKFAENGADVVVNARNQDSALQVVEEIKGLGRRASFERAAKWNYQEVKQMVDNATREFGRIDILVASGGGGGAPPAIFHTIDPESYIDAVRSHWLSRLYCIRAALDHMMQRQSGKIIIITTDSGRTPTPGESLIGGAAAALVLMTKVLAQEVARYQIRINTICTTITKDTPGYEYAMANPTSRIFKIFKRAEERMPFGINRPDDIAQLALFLASKDSNQITGQIFSISGGLSFPG